MYQMKRNSSGKRLLFSIVLIPSVILGLMLGTLSCTNIGPLPPSSTIIRIASDFPTSGLEATRGQSLQNGVQMAINEANRLHLLPGYTLQLAPYDDVGKYNVHDPQKGADNIRRAVADNLVAGIIGPLNSTVALAELPITNQASLAQLSPTTTYSCLTKGAEDDPFCAGSAQMRPTGQLTFFRLAGTDDEQGKAAADFLFSQKHYRKAVVIHDSWDVYGRALAEHFLNEWGSFGGLVVPLELRESSSSVQDYQDKLQKIAFVQPDLIYFAGNDPNGTYVLQALSNIPTLKTVAFAGAGGIVSKDFLEAATSLHPSAPIYASLPIQDPTQAGTLIGKDFQKNSRAAGYSNYQPYTASAYDCTMILIQAIKSALQKGVTPPHGPQDHDGAIQFRKAIVQALAHLSYTGATGTHSFDANGDTTNHTVSFYQLDFSAGQADWALVQ